MKISEIQTKKELFDHDQRIRKLEKSGGQQSADIGDLKETVDKNREIVEDAVGRIEILEVKSLTVDSAVIKDLQAKNVEISGKLTAITADIKAVKADYVKTSDLEADYTTTTDLKATYATIGALNAANADIAILQTEKLDAETARATYATITNLNAAVGRIATLETNSLTADSATIKNLQAKDAEIETLVAGKATIARLDAAKARISDIEANYVKTSILEADYTTTKNLQATYATIASLNTANAEIGNLKTGKLDTKTANATYATITNLNAANAEISTLKTGKLDVNTAKATYATITNLNAAEGRIAILETNSLTADSAVITNLQTGLAELDTLIFGSASGTSIHTSFANAVIAQLGNAQIKSAMIDTIFADKITSGSINTDNVTIKSADGGMVISDNTIQIKDGTAVRVQIGKDASGNYSVVICDSSGNVMFNTSGITADAIKSAIIRNDMVADNANISAGKLDIDSLFTVINEDSSHTIKSTQIYMDDVKQTLDVAYQTVTTAVNGLYETVNSQGTQISVIQGQITSKVWQQDISTAKSELEGDISTLSTQYSTLNQTVSGLSSTVGSHTTQISGKADKSTVTQLATRVTQTESSITSQTSSITSLGTRISTVEQTAGRITVRLDTAESDIQTAQETADDARTAAANAQTTANTANSTANTAQSTADTAKTNAANAAKTATNYLKFSSAGLVVGDMTASALGKNVLIYSSGVDIRNGTAVLASFTPTVIKLGNNSSTSKISLLNGIGVIEAVDKDGVNSGDSLRISLNDSESEKEAYLVLNKYYSELYAPSITLNAGSEELVLTAGHGSASIYLATSFASVAAPYLNIGNRFGSYSSQAEIPYLKWNKWNSKTPYIGYASDQTDGTFVWSITGTNYASGLAIGGGSGNLLYKGAVVLNADNYTSYAAAKSHTHSEYAVSDHTHAYLSTGGGTLTGNLTVGSASLETNGYVTGTWLKTTANIALSSAATTFAVLNGGWIYSRTAAQVLSDIGAAAAGHTHSYLEKTTYEYNKELAMGGSGKVCIGKFSMYDSNITVEISSTTSTTYNATLVIATQNYGKGGAGSFTANVYGDASNTIAPNIYIYNNGPSGVVEVYFSPATYSKNLVHIQCMALTAAPTSVLTSISAIPTNATTKPSNQLTNTFATKTYVEQLIGDIENGTY